MRYDGWDAILFSSASAAPIQEFKTTCFDGLDDCKLRSLSIPLGPVLLVRYVEESAFTDSIACIDGREIPTLRSYISSVAQGTPFRISIHNWEIPYKPSAIIESRRKSGEKIMLAVQVSIDGAQLL